MTPKVTRRVHDGRPGPRDPPPALPCALLLAAPPRLQAQLLRQLVAPDVCHLDAKHAALAAAGAAAAAAAPAGPGCSVRLGVLPFLPFITLLLFLLLRLFLCLL